MTSDKGIPEEGLVEAVERAKRDPEFIDHLAKLLERDSEILDRLGDS